MNQVPSVFDQEGYNIVVGDLPNYNEIMVEVWIRGKDVAMVQKEDGPDKIKVELFGEAIVDYDLFLQALQAAKEELLK